MSVTVPTVLCEPSHLAARMTAGAHRITASAMIECSAGEEAYRQEWLKQFSVCASRLGCGRCFTLVTAEELRNPEYRRMMLAGMLSELEFWERVRPEYFNAIDFSERWAHDLRFLDMTVDEVRRADRTFVRDCWPLITSLATVLDLGYCVVARELAEPYLWITTKMKNRLADFA